MIRPVGNGLYVVMSMGGKRLSKPLSLEAAHKRLAEIEYFKRNK